MENGRRKRHGSDDGPDHGAVLAGDTVHRPVRHAAADPGGILYPGGAFPQAKVVPGGSGFPGLRVDLAERGLADLLGSGLQPYLSGLDALAVGTVVRGCGRSPGAGVLVAGAAGAARPGHHFRPVRRLDVAGRSRGRVQPGANAGTDAGTGESHLGPGLRGVRVHFLLVCYCGDGYCGKANRIDI